MADENLEQAKLRLDAERLEIEKARLKLEQRSSTRYITPLISILGAIVAGLFALAQVWVASIQKSKEIDAAKIQKEREIEMAASERERRWKLDLANFVFSNRDMIFSADKNSADQQRIIKVIAVTFPADISAILFENLKAAIPEQQKPLLEEGQRLVESIQQTSQEKLFYVIAMTSSRREDIANEISRVKRNIGAIFDTKFPDVEIYAPAGGGGLYTLLISGKSLPYAQANELKQSAIGAGFSKDT
jgi:hypothetical protein